MRCMCFFETNTQLLHNLLPWSSTSSSSSSAASSPAAGAATGAGVWPFNESSPEANTLARDGPAVDTIRGVAFLHLHGRDLREAWEWVKRFMQTKREADILQVICDWLGSVAAVGDWLV